MTATISHFSLPEYWSIAQVMRFLGKSRRAVTRMCIPHAQLGRDRYYRPKDVVEYLEGRIR